MTLVSADGMGLVQTDNEIRLTRATANLQQVEISDVPGTVRRTARDAIVMLKDAKVSVSLRAANAISMLDEVTQNPCLSSFTRVRLWSVLSELESIREYDDHSSMRKPFQQMRRARVALR